MILFFPDGKQIRGDLISSAVLRSDLAPIPMTLELEVRGGDESFDKRFTQGESVLDALGNAFTIVKSVRVTNRTVQGEREMTGFRVTALLEACAGVAKVRSRAIYKENSTLGAIYKAAGARVRNVQNDFSVPRFYCPVGGTPSFLIAKVLQEEGGVVRWKGTRFEFLGLKDLFAKKPVRTIPSNGAEAIEGGFLERHEVPWFFSLDASGGFIFGNRRKERAVLFSPFKNTQRLQNMTRCLVLAKTAKLGFDQRISAGDLIEQEDGTRYAVVTAAHVYKSHNEDGGTPDTYTKLWLGSLEE